MKNGSSPMSLPPRLSRLSLVPLALCALALTGCQPKVAYNTSISTKEVMRYVIDPAAVELWTKAGEVDDLQGTHLLAPTTDDGWERAEALSTTIAESTNALLLPGRIRKLKTGDDAWVGFVQNLNRNALASKAAAHDHDPKRLFDTGASLYQACTDCHVKYLLPFLDKNGLLKGPLPPGAPGSSKS
jgi:hypothetical protein